MKRIRDFFKKKKPVRLERELTVKERIQNWINRHYVPLFIIGIVIALFLFVSFCLLFVPGTESGIVYNNRTGVI
ncbi:MAG: hypothetical protein IKF82_00535 [Bacilli bacterium]|nr:hypothetical protein [Bacilli bacterium]